MIQSTTTCLKGHCTLSLNTGKIEYIYFNNVDFPISLP